MYGQYQQKSLLQITSSDEGSVGEVAYYRPGLSNSVLVGEEWDGSRRNRLWPRLAAPLDLCWLLPSCLYIFSSPTHLNFILIFCIFNPFLGLFHALAVIRKMNCPPLLPPAFRVALLTWFHFCGGEPSDRVGLACLR